MQVTEAITIFKLSVPSPHLSALAVLFAAYVLIRLRYGNRPSGLFADAAYYFVLIWKGSYVLTDFGSFLKAPLSLLYYNGGLVGALAGLLAALYFLWSKGLAASPAVLTAAVAVQVVYQLMMVLLNDNGILPEIVTVIVFGSLLFLTLLKAGSTLLWQKQLRVLFPVAHLFAASVQPDGFRGLSFVSTLIFCVYRYNRLAGGVENE